MLDPMQSAASPANNHTGCINGYSHTVGLVGTNNHTGRNGYRHTCSGIVGTACGWVTKTNSSAANRMY